ncbi:MAG TPA: hypothetical protein VMB46_08755 [Methanomassiliicoccales archaeon]|nr:hypothetical protein [Methanomassiliicoccales archaeon]
MAKNPGTAIAIVAIACLLLIGSVNLMQLVSADDVPAGKAPAPSVSEQHVHNQAETYEGQAQGNFDNEAWWITISQGDLKTLITARNYSNGNQVTVDYGMNFNFHLGGKFYIAMFTIDQVLIKIGDDSLLVPLKNCAGFQLSYTSVSYDGNTPTIDCSVAFKDVRVHPESASSAFDLTLFNHYRGDWNSTSIKVEALLDFTGTNLGPYPAGTPFTVEIHYIMQLTDPKLQLGPPDFNTLRPSRYTNDTMEYNLTGNDGSPYTLSKLDMNDAFTINNETGAYAATGYSRIDSPNSTNGMQYNHNARVVTHGFPGLVYGSTTLVRSDPQIVVYHDLASDDGFLTILVAIAGVAAAGCLGAFVLVRRKRRTERGNKEKGAK